jgi:HlyD family secretion protein
MKKIFRVFLILLIVIAASAVVSYLREEKNSVPFTLYGNVDIREVDLGFRVSGKLLQMNFEEGDAVKKGDILAVLDDEPYRNELAVAAARVARAEVQLQKLENGSRTQEIKVAEAKVREAESVFNNALREYNRQKALLSTNSTSQQSLDQVKASSDEAKARLNSAKESLALVKEGFRSEDILAGRKELQETKAKYKVAETLLADTTLIAPNDGMLITRIHEPGTIVAAGTPVYTLSLRNPVYVRAYVAEPDLGKVAPGTKVEITTDSTDSTYSGTIGFISPRAEFTPKNVETADLRTDLVYRLRIVAEDPENGLRQGMPVTIRLAGQQEKQ